MTGAAGLIPATPAPVAAAPQAVPTAPPQQAAAPQINPALQANFAANQQFLAEGDHTYNTQLTPQEEVEFRQYLTQHDPLDLGRKDFNPDAHVQDYDMRGWWKAMKAGDEKAKLVIDPDDGWKHRNDYWKTPYHQTFSADSQWAGKTAPKWKGNKLIAPNGKVIFDGSKQNEQ